MRIGEKTRFARIWPGASKKGIFLQIDSRESIRANLRNVGVRIACPLRLVSSQVHMRAQVLPDLRLAHEKRLRTAILLHDNLLSCYVPWCGNTTAAASIIAIGNRLRP